MQKLRIYKILLVVISVLATSSSGWSQTPGNGVVTNQNYFFNPAASGAGPHCFKIATLYANTDTGLDHLHILVTTNSGWWASANASIDAIFGNRGVFAYTYTSRGAPVNSFTRLVAYQNADTSVDLYLMLADQFVTGSYTILENLEETVYTSPVDLQGTTPSGMLIFDSSSPNYPPSTFQAFGGNMGIGTTAPGAKLEVNGNVKLTAGSGASITFPDNTVQSTAWNGTLYGGDYAESVDIVGDRSRYEPGDVLVVDPDTDGRFLKGAEPYSKLVAGIYSTKPGVLGRRQTTESRATEVPMAMVGIVPTKVSAENGSIKRGDLLVLSSTLGHAMKGTDSSLLTGAVIGKALGSLASGTGVIEVLVSLQ